MESAMSDRPLDIDEAVVYLRERGYRTTKKSLYSMVCRKKQTKAFKIGRWLRFHVADLDAFVESITRKR
jgi:hypothetical protein